MKFDQLSPEDQKLVKTDFGGLDKVAEEMVKQAAECYNRGLEKTAVEIADGIDKTAEEEEAAAEKFKKDKEEDDKKEKNPEHEKAAAELGAVYERGVFDGLAKLGQERHQDPMHYFWPFIEEKVAQAGAEAALAKFAQILEKQAEGSPGKKPEEGHMVRRALLGTPVSAAIEAEKGKKMKAFGKTWLHGAKSAVKGAVGGGAAGAAVGAGVGALTHHGAKAGAKAGGMMGAHVGSTAGALHGAFGRKASELHGEHSKNKTKD